MVPRDQQKHYFFFCEDLLVSNSVDGRLAWALAREASEERTLLAHEEILLVPDERTEFLFSSPDFSACRSLLAHEWNA